MLFTFVHTVAKQPMKIDHFGGNYGYNKLVSDVIISASQRHHIFVYIGNQRVIY